MKTLFARGRVLRRLAHRTVRGVMLLVGVLAAVATGPSDAAVNDFDGDGKSDLTVFRSNWPWTGATSFFVVPSSGANLAAPPNYAGWVATGGGFYKQWGLNGDKPVVGDYAGLGRADFAVYRPKLGMWFIAYSCGGTFSLQYGLPEDMPVQGDYDGDGKTDICLYRPSTNWIYVRSSRTLQTANYRGPTVAFTRVVPLPHFNPLWRGPYGPTLALYCRDQRGTYIDWRGVGSVGNGSYGAMYAANEDVPVAGDFTGDRQGDAVCWKRSTGQWLGPNWEYARWGLYNDTPISGDFDGDGKNDPCVWRRDFPWPGYTSFFVKPSSGANLAAAPNPVGWQPVSGGFYKQWGFNTDLPLGAPAN